MPCPRCQHESPSGARFCGACGAPLESSRVCPGCTTPNPPEHRFCHACGTALGEPPAAPPPAEEPPRDPRAYTPRHLAERILVSKSALEGERRRVTVVFMDVAGFTPLSEKLDPEAMHALMDRCFRVILEHVHHYEGTVNQFTGDGVMALFGAPVALEDAPRRAVAAALRVQEALGPLRDEVRERLGAEFRLRVGIHTGLVVVGRIGDDLRMDYTAVGDTTNLAARLQQMAAPGSVWISEATAHLVSPYFELRDLGERSVKGREEAVHAWQALAARPVVDRVEAAADPDTGAGLTPYVGRERELEGLLAAFESAGRGQGRVVFLVGEAGIGKSRLLHEFRRRLGPAPHSWFEGRCASYGRSTAYGPIVDGLRRLFGIEDRDDDASALARIDAVEERLGGELAWTLPFLRGLLSLPVGDAAMQLRLDAMDAGTRRSETLRALQARFLRLAERAPLVVVIEDLHWIDAASEEVLTFLAESVPTSRVLLVLTHRPGYRHPFGDRSFQERISLQALSVDEMARMASGVLASAELPEELQALLAAKAEGNPFFLEEVTCALREEGVLSVEDGRAVLDRAAARIEIPDRVQDVLMARLDRLPEQPRRAIQVASVIGREFALRLLQRIHEVGAEMQPIVEELRALELIYEKAAHPELAYMFKHALTHDVAYESVLVERRKALHRVVGGAIEELYRDRLAEHYEALAHHFGEGEDWERALLYHEQAAEKAARGYANHAVVDHCRQALAIAERLAAAGDAAPAPRLRALAERLARAHMSLSEFAASGEAQLRAAGWAAGASERAASLSRAAYALHWAHDYEGSRRASVEARELAREHALGPEEGRALMVRSFSLMTTEGMAAYQESGVERILELTTGDDDELAAFTLHHVGEAAEWRGEFRRAIDYQERALAIAKRERVPDLLIMCRWFIGKASCCLGAYGRALEVLEEAVDLSDRMGDRAWKTRLLNTLGWCLAEVGDPEAALDCNRRSTALAEEMVKLDLVPGAPELYGNAAVNLALNELDLDEVPLAWDRLQAVLASLEASDDPWMRWRYAMHVSDGLARAELARGNPDAALAWLDREAEDARLQHAPKVEARALELRGRALLRMDLRLDAAEALAGAAARAAEIGYPPVQWRARALLAELARREGDASAAQQHAAEATHLVRKHARSLEAPRLRRRLEGLATLLAEDPLGALS